MLLDGDWFQVKKVFRVKGIEKTENIDSISVVYLRI